MKLEKGLEHHLREVGFFSLEKRRMRRDFLALYLCLERGHRKVGAGLFSQINSNRKIIEEMASSCILELTERAIKR